MHPIPEAHQGPSPVRADSTPTSYSLVKDQVSTKTSRGGRSSGPAGKLLDELLASIGLKREDVYINQYDQVPRSQQPRSPPGRDRGLQTVPGQAA